MVSDAALPTALVGVDGRGGLAGDQRSLLLVIIDGWTRRPFLRDLAAGHLNGFSDLLGIGAQLLDVVAPVPTVSLASHATLLTGSAQCDHRVAGHRWFDVASRRPRSYLGPGIRQLNDDLSPSVQTVFESWPGRTVSVQSPISRGADEVVRLPTMDSAKILHRACDELLAVQGSAVVAWLPMGDRLAHTHGPDSDSFRVEMRTTADALRDVARRLSDSDRLQNTQILMVPDHGHVLVRERVRLERLIAEAALSGVQNPKRRVPADTLVAMSNGDRSASIYLPDVVDPERFVRWIGRHPTIDLAVLDQGDRVLAVGTGGEAHVKSPCDIAILGDDPLLHALHSDGSVSEAQLDLARTELAASLLSSRVTGRSGQLLVLAAPGCHFSKSPRLGWSFGRHRGSHGGATIDESVVAAVVLGGADLPASTPMRDLLQLAVFRPSSVR